MAKKWWYFLAGWLLGGFFPLMAIFGKLTGGLSQAGKQVA
jgi:hypothetical protein